MNKYNQFINQEIVNKKGDKGIVVSLTDERITIDFPTGQIIYKPDIAFKSSFIKFVDETMNGIQFYNFPD